MPAVLVVATAAAWVVVRTALATEMFRAAAAVNEAAAPLVAADPLAETRPGPVAREVLPAWVVVVVAVAVADDAAAVEAVAGDSGCTANEELRQNMKAQTNNSLVGRIVSFACALALFSVVAPARYAVAQPSETEVAPPGKVTRQKKFATSKLAADALISAAEQFDVLALLEIIGPHGSDLVQTADKVQDKQRATTFAAKAREKTLVTPDPKNPNRVILSVGNEDWPYPVPIVKRSGQWFFDTRAGRKEILDRRIGANELDALTICRGYVEVQKEYALQAHDGVNQYAQKIISTPGKQDGLAWQNEDGSWSGPVAEGIAKALAQGYTTKAEPYHGYYFKILKGQGPAAPLGRIDFVVKGVMIGGFALVAVPAEYRVTGVKTFIVSHEGIVFEKDLGPNSLELVKEMELYNPDKTWRRTDDGW